MLLLWAGCGDALPERPGDNYPTPLSPGVEPTSTPNTITPIPRTLEFNPDRVALGRQLYFDKRLSGDGQVTCNDCHNLALGGSNGEARSTLPGRKPVGVNVPTIFNLAFDFRFAWSGKFYDVVQQIDAAMGSPEAMAGGWDRAYSVFAKDADLVSAFARTYPEGMTADSLRDSVVVYSLSLTTPGARFDTYLAGEEQLSEQEQRGYEMFRDYGCISCHQGVNVGGNMFQKFGVMRDYFSDRGEVKKADLGLFAYTGEETDMFVFRVPSLRNVALTAPYFHDASADTLDAAVQTMARYQLGRELDRSQVQAIVAFLNTLTGEVPGGQS